MENVQIHIRRLQKKDAAAICRIYADITRKPVEPDFKHILEAHAAKEKDACYVAECDGQVVGFMISYLITGGFGLVKSAWIANLGIEPKFMGMGIGIELAQKIIKRYKAEGIENIFTSVRWDSTDLLSFFSNLGFNRSDFVNLRKEI